MISSLRCPSMLLTSTLSRLTSRFFFFWYTVHLFFQREVKHDISSISMGSSTKKIGDERSRWNNYGINNNERRLYGGGTNAVGGKKRVWEKWLISNLLEGVYCHPLRWIETVTEKPRVILYVGGLALALFAIVYL